MEIVIWRFENAEVFADMAGKKFLKGFIPLEISRRNTAFLTGFTYIEVLITLAIVAVLFVPMMQLFSRSLYSSCVSGDMLTALDLARWEMERVKNLKVSKYQLAGQGDVWIPELKEAPFEINKRKWRIQRHVVWKESYPLEVTVAVFTADNLEKPLASLNTLIEDTVWVDKNLHEEKG